MRDSPIPAEIGDGTIAVRYDHTLEELRDRLGVRAERTERAFLAEQRPPRRHE